MKKYLFFALALLVVACEKPVLDEDIASTREANVILHMTQYEQESFGTRAATDITELCSRLNVAIFDADGTKVKTVAQKEGDASYGTVALTLAAGTYQLVVIAPFRDGLLVENPQCFSDDEAGIHNDVPRLLYYRQGRCLTPQETVAYQVADVNTGADIHYSTTHQRVCFVSHRQPLVEFYDDSLHLVHSLTMQSGGSQKIHIGNPQTVMHQQRQRGETGPGIRATFDKTQRVVGAGSQFHAFLCSAADEEHIFLVYCGKMFAHDYHTYPSYILVLDWNGNLTGTYRFDRWIQAISPGTETGVFYLTVYADDDSSSARMKLIKVVPRPVEETDSLANENKDTVRQ